MPREQAISQKPDSRCQRVISYLRERPATASELAQHLNAPCTSITSTLVVLSRGGAVSELGRRKTGRAPVRLYGLAGVSYTDEQTAAVPVKPVTKGSGVIAGPIEIGLGYRWFMKAGKSSKAEPASPSITEIDVGPEPTVTEVPCSRHL